MATPASVIEKGGSTFAGIKLLLCENPLPPLDEAIAAAARELPRSNFYTEQFSQPLREAIGRSCGVSVQHVHVNAGSELIRRQLVARFGRKTHLTAPTFAVFEETARRKTHTYLRETEGFQFDLRDLKIPADTSLTIIVNPNNPNGAILNLRDNPELLERHPSTTFLVDEAFIEFGGTSVTDLVPDYPNLVVTRTFSKAFSLAGLRVCYAIGPAPIIDQLNRSNDAYPLARPAQAAALTCLEHLDKIAERVQVLKGWAQGLARDLQRIGIQTFPTETYFFLGKVPRMRADASAAELLGRNILVKALRQPGLGEGVVRFTTSTPHNNAVAVEAVRDILRVA